jgi:hypothetical protein
MSYRVWQKGKNKKSQILTVEEICTALREKSLGLEDQYLEHFGKPDFLLQFGQKLCLGDNRIFREAYAGRLSNQDDAAYERQVALQAEATEVAAEARRRSAQLRHEQSLLHGLSGFQISIRANFISLLIALAACPPLIGRMDIRLAAMLAFVFIVAIHYLRPRRAITTSSVLCVPLFTIAGIMAAETGLGAWFHGCVLMMFILVGSLLAGEFGRETTSVLISRLIILTKYSYALVFSIWIGCSFELPFSSILRYLDPYFGRSGEQAFVLILSLLPLIFILVRSLLGLLLGLFTWLKDGPRAGL